MSKKKKLVIFVPSIEDGGVEKNLFLITNYLSERNINVNLITANLDKKKNFSKQVNFISPQSSFFNKKNRLFKTLFCFYLLLKFYLKNKDILLLSFQANIYAIFFASLFCINIITRSNTAPDGWSSNIIKRFIFKIFFKYPKKIIVNSLDFKKQLDKEFGVNSLCIYNPLNDEIIKKKVQSKIKFSFFKKKFNNIINIGRMTDQKDQILLLKALNKLKNQIKFKLIILGKGKNKQHLENFIFKNNLKENIKIIGYKKNPYPYLKKADIFILSSKFEGLPNVLLEAQYLRKIIISSNCPTGPREILLGGKAGFLFQVGNVNELKNKILFVTNKTNKKNIKDKIKKGYDSIYRFGFNKNMNLYLNEVKKYL